MPGFHDINEVERTYTICKHGLLNLAHYIKMLYIIQYIYSRIPQRGPHSPLARAAIKAPTPLHTTPAPTGNVWLPNFVTAPLTRLVNHTGKDVGLFQGMLCYQCVEFIL